MRRLPVVAAGIVVAAVAPSGASACGIPFDIVEQAPLIEAERALVTFDGKREELITRLDVRTSGKGTAVLLPVPATPRIRSVPKGLFKYLGNATQPEIRIVRRPGPPLVGGGGTGGGSEGGGVTEISRKEVGAYDVAVLAATNVRDLQAYLDENGFRITRKSTAVLRSYVQKRWRFVAIKTRGGVPRRARLKPLGISFPTKQIIYPTSHGTLSRKPVDLAIYTLTAHRMRLGSLKTEFAGRVSSLKTPPKRFRTLLSRAPYLTKLGSARVASAALKRDLVAKQAASDAPFREVEERIVYEGPQTPQTPPPPTQCDPGPCTPD